ncbi:hypothetical protein [Pseudomonas fortuita]|uniref:hypothetical protein n=1 Tax=Pseudomonas fortuita TaxID=3233375 RepID=UPI003DA133B2
MSGDNRHIQRPISAALRPEGELSFFERWLDEDYGLIWCWERGRRRSVENPALVASCLAGNLPSLSGRIGLARNQGQTKESLKYLAEWQGLRGENLNIKLDIKVFLTCSESCVEVSFEHDSPRDQAEPVLPLVDLFESPCEIWSSRPPTEQEQLDSLERTGQFAPDVDDKKLVEISSAYEAAEYVLSGGVGVQRLVNFLDRRLRDNRKYLLWRVHMPSITPSALKKYKSAYPKYDLLDTDFAIHVHGAVLSEGQYLFHGGTWPAGEGDEFVTRRPLSTTFCPQVALSSSFHKGKAYKAGKIELFVLRASEPKTRVFSYKINRGNLAHEKEVVFACGARLALVSRILVTDRYAVYDASANCKEVPVFVLAVTIS